jgi:hypothetical protein
VYNVTCLLTVRMYVCEIKHLRYVNGANSEAIGGKNCKVNVLHVASKFGNT